MLSWHGLLQLPALPSLCSYSARPTFITTMPKTIHDLPVELILHVLEEINDSHDLFSIIRALPRFNAVWKTHTASISAQVLARSVEDYDIVKKLDDDFRKQGPQGATSTGRPTGFEETVERHKRILDVVRQASAFSGLYMKGHNLAGYSFGHRAVISDPPSSRRAFYYLWRLVRTSDYGLIKKDRGSSYRPFSLPLDFEMPETSDIFAICELIGWVLYSRTTGPDLANQIPTLYNIYDWTNRRRCRQSERWVLCCGGLWDDSTFRTLRHTYWTSIRLSPLKEPLRAQDLWASGYTFLSRAKFAIDYAEWNQEVTKIKKKWLIGHSMQPGPIKSTQDMPVDQ